MQFVELANRFRSTVRVYKDNQIADGKSIREMAMLAATRGTKLTLEIDGQDAEQAMQALTELITKGFDELSSAESHQGAGEDAKNADR